MMTEREHKVIDLYDRGFRSGEIAASTGIKPADVLRIIGLYGEGDNGFEDGIIKGTRNLRIAIEQAHPDRKQELRV